MRRFGQSILLKEGKEKDYIYYHRKVWPGVLQMISKCHIQNYSIYIKGNTLFAYYEYVGENYAEDMKKMAADPETQKWWDLVKPLMQPLEDRGEGEFWAEMEEIFHLE